ncbi:hypothetical protein XELAEV_18027819mg [Xenopus laevis]|uniref:Uncharacterized protein n=1 Tax=Xenopus laevis TaxID=8355 RepID=A0A974CY89_XENLA|nr:hypothetical protein XELAEV_18027819mg [Xenopus laevis]
MGEIEGTYRILQMPGTRLGMQKNVGISTLEPGQNLSTAITTSPKSQNHDSYSNVLLLDGSTLPLEIGVRL